MEPRAANSSSSSANRSSSTANRRLLAITAGILQSLVSKSIALVVRLIAGVEADKGADTNSD